MKTVTCLGLAALRASFSKLVFRRVTHVPTEHLKISSHVVFSTDDSFVEYLPGQLPDEIRNDKRLDSYVENYGKFTAYADKPLRSNDTVAGGISLYSRNQAVWNHLDFQLGERVGDDSLVPYIGALVVGTVAVDKHGRTYYEKWCQISDQFLRAWTMVVYGADHPSIQALREPLPGGGELESTKRAVMRGNKLTIANGVLYKEALANEHSNLPPFTNEQIRKKYCRLHTESITRSATHLHWYNLLVTLAVFNELPCEYNLPNNVRGARLNKWIVPDQDVEYLSKKLLVMIVGEKPAEKTIEDVEPRAPAPETTPLPPSPVLSAKELNKKAFLEELKANGVDASIADAVGTGRKWSDDE
jgi:hypothetical protein